jgi:hypothetical protein
MAPNHLDTYISYTSSHAGVMTGNMWTNIQRCHYLSFYYSFYTIFRGNNSEQMHVWYRCRTYLSPRIHFSTMFHQIFHNINMSSPCCLTKCSFSKLKQNFTITKHFIDFKFVRIYQL